ncbi:MAG: hypothetical protein U0T84_05965 [Chitinophagales bacterium]
MAKDIQAKATKLIPFEVYRYQLVVNKTIQFNIGDKYETAEDIRADKNRLFAEILDNEKFRFTSSHSEITSKQVFTKGDKTFYRLGVSRPLKFPHKDFTDNEVENFPNIIVGINNNPSVQKILIQKKKGFSDTRTVSHILELSFNAKLQKQNLSFYIELMFDKNEFWNQEAKYKGGVTQLTFDLISSNMAMIFKSLKLDLKEIYEGTNIHKTQLQLNSDKDHLLQIDESSKFVNSLVEYSSEGAGNLAMRVKSLREQLHTAQSITEFSIDEQPPKSNYLGALKNAFCEILIYDTK